MLISNKLSLGLLSVSSQSSSSSSPSYEHALIPSLRVASTLVNVVAPDRGSLFKNQSTTSSSRSSLPRSSLSRSETPSLPTRSKVPLRRNYNTTEFPLTFNPVSTKELPSTSEELDTARRVTSSNLPSSPSESRTVFQSLSKGN